MASVKSEEDVTTKRIETSSTISVTTSSSSSDLPTKDTKEKRQLDHHQTANHPHHHHRHQSSDPVYSSSQANNFVIRAYNGNRRPHANLHQQYLRESSPPTREQQSQLQSEPAQEAAQQQYVYLPESTRGQQQIFRPAHYSKQGPIRKPQSVRPVQLVQEIPQYSPHPYPLIPEDQLLKLLEEELASKGITNLQQNQQQQQPQREQKIIQTQTRKPSQQPHSAAESQSQPGLGNYRQAQQTAPDNLEYVYIQQQQQQEQEQQQPLQHQQQPLQHQQQPLQQQPLQHQQQQQQPVQQTQAQQYYASPFLQHRPATPATLSQQSLYPSPQAPLDYHSSIPNHPLAASSLEKEIEKLFAPKKPKPTYEPTQPELRYGSQPHYQAYKTSKAQPVKSYGTTPSPTEKQYSFLPSLAEFSGFKQEESPDLELPEQKNRQYLPKAYPTRSEYLKESKQTRRPKPQVQQSPFLINKAQQQSPTQFYTPIQQIHSLQQHHSQTQQSEFVPIANPNQSKNSAMKLIDAPSLQYEKQRTSPTLFYNHGEQQQSAGEQPHNQHLIPAPHPSHSSIFVSQGTGLHPTTPQPSHLVKAYGVGREKNEVRLPPPNSKPISQQEFQALVDAGYPVQAVPVPVPVPYEKYIKDHPEYKNQVEQQQTAASNQHNSRAGGITYLHPIHEQQNEDEFNEKNT